MLDCVGMIYCYDLVQGGAGRREGRWPYLLCKGRAVFWPGIKRFLVVVNVCIYIGWLLDQLEPQVQH